MSALRIATRGSKLALWQAEHVHTGAVVALKTVKRAYGNVLAGLRLEIHALSRIHALLLPQQRRACRPHSCE